MDYKSLARAVAQDAALRRRQMLQPVGGKGDKIFSPDASIPVGYALRADDPSGEKSTTQHGANRLAALGLPLLTAAPARRGGRVRLQVPGGVSERNGLALHWPIWREPIGIAGLRALLSHPGLPDGPAALGHLGVVEVRSARRIGVGKFMNFTRAGPVPD
jgi:hypothetical protein